MIFLGSDHAGFRLKESIKPFLKEWGYNFIDLGNKVWDPDDDYPEFGYRVAKQVSEGQNDQGVLFCGNAEGICIVANKVKGIRAAIGYNEYAARTSREDDDANVLCLPGRVINKEEAKNILKIWLSTSFTREDRHVRRLEQIHLIENEQKKEGYDEE